MSCTFENIIVPNDIDDKYRNLIINLSEEDETKSALLLNELLSNDFKTYLQINIDSSIESYRDININHLEGLLSAFYNIRHPNVDNTINKITREEFMFGFETMTALNDAVDFTSSVIIDFYLDHITKYNTKINPNEILSNVAGAIFNTFIDVRAKEFFDALIDKKLISEKDINIAKELQNKRNSLKKEIKEAEDNVSAIRAEKFKTQEEREDRKKRGTAAVAKVDSLKQEFKNTNNRLFAYYSYLLDKQKKNYPQLINFTNLVKAIKDNPNEWFRKALTKKGINKYKRQFEDSLENDIIEYEYYEDDNDNIDDERNSINEEYKRFLDDNNKFKDYTQLIETDVKLYLSSIKEMNSTSYEIDKNGNPIWNYSKNNSLGTSSSVGADWLIVQISNLKFYDLNTFIEALKNASENIDGLQCLAKIIYDCKNNPVFAHRLFHELSNNRMAKDIIDIENFNIKNHNTNGSSDPVSYLIYGFSNDIKYNMRDAYEEDDTKSLLKYASSNFINESDINHIISLMTKYIPNIDINALRKYLTADVSDTRSHIHTITGNLSNIIRDIKKLINDENEIRLIYNQQYAAYKKHGSKGIKPTLDFSSVNYSKFNKNIIPIAQALAPYTIVNNELNSVNAEGNLSSDLLQNSNITNLIKQINYGTEEDPNYGLRKLGEFVYGVPQYEHSTIFWGVKNSAGKIISPGLFIKTANGFEISEAAKQLINVSLFDGVRNQFTEESELYSGMPKGDYFLSNIIAFNQPSVSFPNAKITPAGYFMRTPSDAPKNFIITSRRLKFLDLFTISNEDKVKQRRYSNTKYNNFENAVAGENEGRPIGNTLLYNQNNFVSIEYLYNLVTNLPQSFNFHDMQHSIRNKKVYVPIKVQNEKEIFTVVLVGNIDKNNKTVINNVKIDSSISNNSKAPNIIPAGISKDLTNYIYNKGLQEGEYSEKINRNNELFNAFRQTLLGEVHNLIFNLNNVLKAERSRNGVVTYNTVEDTTRLFDRYHYNGELVKDGKLTGNVFTIQKLFATSTFNANDAIMQAISLYGVKGKALLSKNRKGGLTLNRDFADYIHIDDTTEQISLNEDKIAEIINDITEKWIKAYVADVINESMQYKSLLENRHISNNNVLDAMLNAAAMEMSFDDLFEGDSKFYKDTRDFFKRAKEVQASGKSYGGYSLNDSLGTGLIDYTFNGEVQSVKVGNITIPIRNGFTGVTINNTVRVSDNAENIYKELLEVNKNLPESTRKRVALQIARGYGYQNEKRGKTKVNDAQSYITIQEWIRRRYLDGTLDQYAKELGGKNVLEELINPNADLSKLDIQKLNKFVQVQKNFYFDRQKDAETNTVYARQIKNAEFVLISSLIKGTSLETLYNLMLEKGIDQINTVETDKAAKRTILTFWDNDGKVTDENLNNFSKALDDKRNTETYYYRYLYKQQSVAQHMIDTENKAGIQILKKIIDNADPNNPIIQKHINNFFEAYTANIKNDCRNFIRNMGWIYNEDKNGRIIITNKRGDVKLNFEEFYKRAREEAERLGMDSNFLDYFTTDVYGNPIMPNFMNIASSKSESVAQSMFNNAITRQRLSGWHAAQVTNVGYDSNLKYHNGYIIEEEGSKSYISEEDYEKLSKEEKAKYTKCAYTEVRISRWSKLLPKDKSKEELIKQLNEEGLDLMIGYRIPTEGKQSVAILKVVDILDDIQGSTIIVPDDWVNQTGSDFDVDSVYGITYEMRRDKEGKLHKIVPNFGNTDRNYRTRYAYYITAEYKKAISKDKESIIEQIRAEGFNIPYKIDILDFIDYDKYGDFSDKCATLAKILNAYTENEFYEFSIMEQQSKEARNNIILDSIIGIMSNAASTEENYSRSNFDNLTAAKNTVDYYRKMYFGEENKIESPFNPLDQITFMDNAISGRSLKAFSVSRDTFLSVCNKAQAQLSKDNAITVVYNLNETVKEEVNGELVESKDENGKPIYKYNKEDIIAAYGKNAVYNSNNNTITVTHRQFGWSNNYRNVLGMLLTPYSSQTTAHILDAVKEGSIFNENKFTFGTFKTLIDLGIDYETAIMFLQQPAVTEIVKAYNEINSIYIRSNGNPIEIAFNRIVARSGILVNGKVITDNTPTYLIIQAINQSDELANAIDKLTGGQISSLNTINNGNINLDGKRLQERFMKSKFSKDEKISSYDIIAEDIVTLLMFNKVNSITQRIERVMRCTNPDKFGAKQSIFATRKVVDNIKHYISTDKITGSVLKVGDKSLLKAIYPGIMEDAINIEQSIYPYLAGFMKYATMTSIDINKQLFTLENDNIYYIMTQIEEYLGKPMTDKLAKEFKQYLVTDVYRKVSQFTTPYIVNQYGYFEPIADNIYGEDKNGYTAFWNAEIDRINGYKNFDTHSQSLNINNTDKESLTHFAKLSPAQKVVFIQKHYGDKSGVFNFIKVSRRNNKDELRFNDTLGNIEDIFKAFEYSFFNGNPYFKMAALDLVKYAFVVDGFKFKKGGISKIIPNSVLLADVHNKGLGLLDSIKDAFYGYSNITYSNDVIEKLINNFVRSHSNEVNYIRGENKKIGFAKAISEAQKEKGVIKINFNNSESSNLIFRRLKINVDKNGKPITNSLNEISHPISYFNYIYKDKKGKNKVQLYRIVYGDDCIYIYPLNKLERNEISDYSYNNDNNTVNVEEYYKAVINKVEYNKAIKVPNHITNNINASLINDNFIMDLLNDENKNNIAVGNKIIKEVSDWIQLPVEKRGNYHIFNIDNPILAYSIPNKIKVPQKVIIDGIEHYIYISKYKPSKNLNLRLKGVDINDKIDSFKNERFKQKYINKIALTLEESNFYSANKSNIDNGLKINSNFYSIEIMSVNDINSRKERLNKINDYYEYEENTPSEERYSVTPLIDTSTVGIPHEYDSLDIVAKDIVNDIFDDNYNARNENTTAFLDAMSRIALDSSNTDSIHNNRNNVYHEAASYYENKANDLLSRINNFILDETTGESYNIKDENLYFKLRNYKNKYEELVKLILEAYTFGNKFSDITLLDLTGEDATLTADIEKIKKIINSITQNNDVKAAMANIFNIYIADSISTNPNIRHGLIVLREAFDDTDRLDNLFSDIGFINNNQVQAVIKYITGEMNEVSRFKVHDAVDKYESEYERIMKMAGTIDMNHVINEDGYIHKKYTKEFVEEYRGLIQAVSDARNKFGYASEQYWETKIKKDEFEAKYINKPIIKEYYDELNNINKKVFTNAKNKFLEYQELLVQLRALSGDYKSLSIDQLSKRRDLINKLSFFTSKFNFDGSVKNDEELAELEYIKEYKKAKKELNDKYYDNTILDEVKDKISNCLETIRLYDEVNPDMSLSEKLEDEDYRDAYEWLQYNTVRTLDKDTSDKLAEAYAKYISEESNKMIQVNNILAGHPEYIDPSTGNYDYSKVSIEDMNKIKAIYETEDSKYYEEEDAETGLLRIVKPTKKVIPTEEYYRKLKDIFDDTTTKNISKDKLVKRINELLLRGMDNDELSVQKLFTELSVDEIDELVLAIQKLRIDYSGTLEKDKLNKLKQLSKRVIDKEAKQKFQADNRWAKDNLGNQYDSFLKIFGERTKKGMLIRKNGKYAPNSMLYSYSVPIKKRYIDTEKTNAANFINENIIYTLKSKYEETAEHHRRNGTYDVWFKANHIYNPYTHKMEPLPIWKDREINPSGSLHATYEYNPSFEFYEHEVKDEYINDKYDEDSKYNYNNDPKYRNPVTQNAKEEALAKLFENTLNELATTKAMRRKAEQGFMPRRRKINKNSKWFLRNAAGMFGLDWISNKDINYSDNIKYETDRDGDLSVLQLLRKKGSIDLSNIKRGDYATEDEYNKAIEEAKKNNKSIDREIRDTDWNSIMKNYIEKATIYNAKERLKNTSLLLLEDLKRNEAHKINHRNNVSMSKKRSTSHYDITNTVPQTRTIENVEIWHRRFFRNQFKKQHRFNPLASMMQNMTSGKYMIFNVTGGVANVWTGIWNIIAETFANDFLSNKDFFAAVNQYMTNIPSFFAEMYSETSSNMTNAFIKTFQVVDYEAMSERRPNEKTSEYIKRTRNFMYGLQSGGEHFMQNCVMLGMLKSHRVYEETDKFGNKRYTIGNIGNYIWEIERTVLRDLVEKDEILKSQYAHFIKDLQNNYKDLYKIVTLKEDFNVKFLKTIGDNNLIKEYIKAKKEAIENAKKEFYNDSTHPTFESLFELRNGRARIKDGSPITERQAGDFINKVIYANKEIHGVYDKIGAAKIEEEWWGGLAMQYHKHLYPGIMKRWRIKGYFNEQTEHHQKGAYISAINFLTIDFDNAIQTAKNDSDGKTVKMILKSIQNVSMQAISNVKNINMNWALLPEWEKANILRSTADTLNTLACITLAIGMHCVWDEDEFKESNTLSTALYLADRFASEAQAFTPWGAIGEAKTLWSSPIASTNTPQDIIKLTGLLGQLIFDPDFETNFSTGLYKGRNKFEVYATRNIPIIRIKNRLDMMSKSNEYYRLNHNMLKIIPTEAIARRIKGED